MDIVSVYLPGRCRTGSEQQGTLVHAYDASLVGYPASFDPALCGRKPGRTSFGFDTIDLPVTCPKCLKKMQKLQGNKDAGTKV